MNYLDEILNDKLLQDKPAIVQEGNSISYKELYFQSKNLKNYMSYLGVSSSERVVLLMEKSIEAIVSIFSVLMNGSTYIPVDCELPIERIEFIIKNSNVKTIIVDEHGLLKLNLSSGNFIECIICIEKDDVQTVDNKKSKKIFYWNTKNEFEDSSKSKYIDQTAPERSINDLAYIIYTSGSTGVPKGVMISHRNIVTFVNDIKKIMHYNEETVFLNVAPLHFDASVLDIFCILNSFGTVVLMKKFVFPNELLSALEKYNITDTLLVSSILKLFVSRYSNFNKFNFPMLKTIWYGAEGCSVKTLRAVKNHLPNISFIHGYGPTETTHTALMHKFENVPDDLNNYMPIGRPMPSVYVYALNENGKIIQPGEKGELYIGGKQVMQGYCNDNSKTNTVLVKDLFDENNIVYRSGDIVTVDANGDYWYVGRNDDMIKNAGNLVYLSEIEHAILSVEFVKDVVVFTVADEVFNNRIKACIILKEKLKGAEEDIREQIMKTLPVYMLPSEIVFWDDNNIPRNGSGKIDKPKLISMIEKH